jgi:hypothetical protein
MLLQLIEVAAGLIIVAATLLDVFSTAVVPGRVGVGLRIPRALRFLVLPAWRRVARRFHPDGRGTITGTFAGALLFGTFAAWVLLLMNGLALMAHGLRGQFDPPLQGYDEALFQVGSAMMTLGLNGVNAHGWSRAVIVLSGVLGLQVVTLTLTYIVQLQAALQQRDPLVLRLGAAAGTPPTGLQLLLTVQQLDLGDELAAIFDRWDAWAAELRHAHRAHPVLVYFRSADPREDWVTALGALLDAAVLVLAVQRDGQKGRAELFYRHGSEVLRETIAEMGLAPLEDEPVARAEVDAVIRRFEQLDCRTRPAEEALQQVRRLRSGYWPNLRALGQHFDVDVPELVPAEA